MDDNPKKRYDPLFDDIFKGMFNIPKPPPKPVPSPFDPFVIEIPMPRMHPADMIRELLRQMQLTMPPPKPYGKHDAALYDIATSEFGLRPVVDTKFGIDVETKFLLVDPRATYPHRVLSLSHELGHATRLRSGKLDLKKVQSWHSPLGQNDPELCRYMQIEETMAWREGMRILQRIGCRLSSPRAARMFRNICLSTYRLTTRIHPGAVRRLTVKE